MNKSFTFADISQEMPEGEDWNDTGVVILRSFLPSGLIDRYCAVREQLNRPGGWESATPYMEVPVLKDIGLYPPLMRTLSSLVGEDMGMHLNLTGWVSTERNFHQDTYLNPPHVGDGYAAVWMALDDIHPDSGPFQYVPGSHKWPAIMRDKLLSYYPPEMAANGAWPRLTQDEVARCMEEELARRGGEIVTHLPKRGDVLIWHGRLMHRGSEPKVPGMLRKSLICHYSALSKRLDMPVRAEHTPGCWYFVLPGGVKV